LLKKKAEWAYSSSAFIKSNLDGKSNF